MSRPVELEDEEIATIVAVLSGAAACAGAYLDEQTQARLEAIVRKLQGGIPN